MEYPKKPKVILQICSIILGSIGVIFLVAESYFLATPMIMDFDLTILLFTLLISLLAFLPMYSCYSMLRKYSEKAISRFWGIISILTYFVLTSFDDQVIDIVPITYFSKHDVEYAYFGIALLISYLIFKIGKHYLLLWAVNSKETNKAQPGAPQRTA